jgi:hypothetical protein
MKLRGHCICTSILVALALLLAPGVRADVTIRYQSEFKPAAALQPILQQLMKATVAGSETSLRMQGNKGYVTVGNWTEVFDFVKGEVTLVDPAHKTFAALPVSQLADKMAGAMPQMTSEQMQALESVKTDVGSRITGKTAEIQGVQAEEREVTLTVDLPLPGMNQTGPGMKLVMHIWTAKQAEALRVPAIRELTGYQAWQRYFMNPAGMIGKMMPGMNKTIGPMIEEMFKNQSVILRTRMEVYMPFLAVVQKQALAQGQSFPALDPDAPLLEMNQEVAELSSAPVDASLFEIPKDYSAVPAEDIIRDMVKAQTPK